MEPTASMQKRSRMAAAGCGGRQGGCTGREAGACVTYARGHEAARWQAGGTEGCHGTVAHHRPIRWQRDGNAAKAVHLETLTGQGHHAKGLAHKVGGGAEQHDGHGAAWRLQCMGSFELRWLAGLPAHAGPGMDARLCDRCRKQTKACGLTRSERFRQTPNCTAGAGRPCRPGPPAWPPDRCC